MQNLFAYGTLMCEEVMQDVSGVCPSPVRGTLNRYRRYSVKGEHYPGIVPNEDCRVQGVVYLTVPESAWGRLDGYEGEMYARQTVEVELADGRTVSASTYVVRPEFRECLDESEWDFDHFLRDRNRPLSC